MDGLKFNQGVSKLAYLERVVCFVVARRYIMLFLLVACNHAKLLLVGMCHKFGGTCRRLVGILLAHVLAFGSNITSQPASQPAKRSKMTRRGLSAPPSADATD